MVDHAVLSRGADFRVNDEGQRALVADLRRRLETAAQGGPPASGSGTSIAESCCPATASTPCWTRAARCLEIAPLAAGGMYDDECPGCRIDLTGRDGVRPSMWMVVCQRPHGQGWYVLPDNR